MIKCFSVIGCDSGWLPQCHPDETTYQSCYSSSSGEEGDFGSSEREEQSIETVVVCRDFAAKNLDNSVLSRMMTPKITKEPLVEDRYNSKTHPDSPETEILHGEQCMSRKEPFDQPFKKEINFLSSWTHQLSHQAKPETNCLSDNQSKSSTNGAYFNEENQDDMMEMMEMMEMREGFNNTVMNVEEREPHEEHRSGNNYNGNYSRCGEESSSLPKDSKVGMQLTVQHQDSEETQSKNPFFIVTFPYLKRQNKSAISKNSSKSEINRSLIKRDLEIAARRKKAIEEARKLKMDQPRKLPGKKANVSTDYVPTKREHVIASTIQAMSSNLSQSSTFSSSKLSVHKEANGGVRKKVNKKLLKSFATRDQATMKKRREALMKARALRLKSNDGAIKDLPGKKASYPNAIATSESTNNLDDDYSSTSSIFSSRTTSSVFNRLYAIGKNARLNDLERSRAEGEEELRPRAKSTTVRAKDDLSLDFETPKTKLSELIKRNRDYASKRRKEIEKARIKMMFAGPTIAPPTITSPPIALYSDEHSVVDDSRSVSASSTTSSLSALSTTSRLNQLYERGKKKQLSDLKKSIKKKQDDAQILNVRKVESANTTCDKLYELSKRNHELGKKRRQEIANARFDASRSHTQLRRQGDEKQKKNDSFDEFIHSLKSKTSSTEEEKLDTSSSEENNCISSSGSSSYSRNLSFSRNNSRSRGHVRRGINHIVENNKNASSYEFLTRSYHLAATQAKTERRSRFETHLSVR